MADQSRKQQHFSRQIAPTNRQSVNRQAAAASFNKRVQMGSASPFATTMENPWLGMNHMLLGSNNLVIQRQTNPMTSTLNGSANSLPDDRSKRPRVSTENQVNNENYINFRVPDYAPRNIKDDMIRIREAEHKLFEQIRRLKMQFADKQNQAVQHLVETVRTPIEKQLTDKDEEIVTMRKLNTDLQNDLKNIRHENKYWMEFGIVNKNQAMTLRKDLEIALAEVRRLQGLVRKIGAVEHTQGKDAGEIPAQKVQTGAAVETGEGSAEKRMCRLCGRMELSVLALPCRHLCFCIVCGSRESGLQNPCPECELTMTATVPI